ncbi:3-phosphoshikimate 1-carboxyvinyltransferase [Oscillospiraceae bacterium WX1]
MDIKITPSHLSGTLPAIASKSQAHRLLIAAALADAPSHVACGETSADIDATAACLSALGAQITYRHGIFEVVPVQTPVTGEKILDCRESGSTLRFMLPVCCALGATASLHMSGRLPNRPLSPLYEELISHGCALSPQGQNPLHTGGQLRGGRYTIAGNISSQYITGLLFSLPLLGEDSVINITGALESGPYVDMTLDVLSRFGITVTVAENRFIVPGNQTFRTPGSVRVEGDWSNAAFWLCAGAIGTKSMTVTNLSTSSLQGDKAVFTVLQRFGATVTVAEDGVTVSRGALRGIDIDAGDTPDLVPVLSAVAAVADGQTRIYNAGRLRIKESDRLKTVTETLSALGADITETEDGLVIYGKKRLIGGTVHAHGDHRIAMTAAVASAVCDGPVVITGAEAVSKSYPGFFNDFAAMGGTFEEVV